MTSTATPRPLDLIALGAVSGGLLGFEVILLRLFEFSHWHHFAGLSISLALLGLGCAGTVLALLGKRALGDGWFIAGVLIAAAGFLFVLWLNSRIALRPVFAASDPGEMLRVLAVDFAAFLPFFGAGLAIGQVFPRWPAHPTRLYSANLLGSGLGSAAASVLLVFFAPESALAMMAAVLAACAVILGLNRRLRAPALLAGVVLLAALFFVHTPPQPRVSDFKALSRLTELPGAEVRAVKPGLAGRLSVIAAPSLRNAPGLSLGWTQPVESGSAAVIGSDRVVTLRDDYTRLPAHAEASLVNLPLNLRPDGRVLAVGSSTWSTPAFAVDRDLVWLEPDRRLTALARERGARFEAVGDSPWRYLGRSEGQFSLIALDGAFAGGDAASEDYLLTDAGLARALERLSSGGLLSVAVGIDYPPRNGPRLLATIAAALESRGASDPGEHVAALRGMQSMLVLIGRDPISNANIEQIAAFSERWQFDRVWLPGMDPAEANQYHVLDEAVFHEAARAAFTATAMPQAAQWFTTEPATLERPYFWRAMQWQQLPVLFERLGRRAASLLDWTLVMSVLSMGLVTVLAGALILVPLGRMPRLEKPFRRLSVGGWFLALGLGFMLVEMAIFQRAILFLDRPVLAASVVFALFLVGAGIGSAMPPRHDDPRRVFAALGIGAAITLGILWLGAEWLLALPQGVRIVALGLVLLPLTWAMGRPLPWSLGRLSDQPRWMPWGWGINAFASVAAAALAPLLSVHFGQPVTVTTAAACYAVAALIAFSWQRAGTATELKEK
ncbi:MULTISPECIES: hypothetical protein [unclassified Wenzhouxiangella]|uniref:hypothetical protein n=1 Tax=unclassified Wenzhouxiangella TaxID=2613841 RepID=UPI000E32C02E|nr:MULTISPECIES: hypothetical protein [unclassified Wenzhouxiangella]RFF26694.1 hypothetical protein DZK25_11540 [Wenzhouxiangella sp. 15181]RFP69336.1 hypothetical protein DZK26_04505 [Wenzhouxiangella sp. 15190]